MIKRKWKGDKGCYFCGLTETVDHLLFECPVAKVLWGFAKRSGRSFYCLYIGPRKKCTSEMENWLKKISLVSSFCSSFPFSVVHKLCFDFLLIYIISRGSTPPVS
jgi:hypothetical protein